MRPPRDGDQSKRNEYMIPQSLTKLANGLSKKQAWIIIQMKSTKVQTLGADHAIEHLAWDTSGQDMCNAQWIQ